MVTALAAGRLAIISMQAKMARGRYMMHGYMMHGYIVHFAATNAQLWLFQDRVCCNAAELSAVQIGFLIRDTLSTSSTYEQAIAVLQDAPLMAPTYITIAGVQPGEAIW